MGQSLDMVAEQAVKGGQRASFEAIGAFASYCLILEVDTWPKPGLVSHIDTGSHRDMDVGMLRRSALFLTPYFVRLAEAGAIGEGLGALRSIGMEAESGLLATTRGVNTHRGAIFGLGLLCAAAGARRGGRFSDDRPLGEIVRSSWGREIDGSPIVLHSHGTLAGRRYGAPGARGEAAGGFRTVYAVGLPALQAAERLTLHDAEAIRVHTIFALIAATRDTNLLYRGGPDGLAFARGSANAFLRAGGIGRPAWRLDAAFIHAEFVRRNLSPGGSADLLAMSLFVQAFDADLFASSQNHAATQPGAQRDVLLS